MKKFFPALIVAFVFTIVLVFQMSINGQESNAEKVDREKEKYSVYEDVFQKTEFQTTKNTNYKLSTVKQPIILLNFWASWCQPCLSEFSTLKKLVNKFSSDELLVIGINNDDENPKKAIIKTEKDLNLNFESVIDVDNKITSSFLIEKIPGSIVFFKGKVIHFENEEFNFMDEKFIFKLKQLLKSE